MKDFSLFITLFAILTLQIGCKRHHHQGYDDLDVAEFVDSGNFGEKNDNELSLDTSALDKTNDDIENSLSVRSIAAPKVSDTKNCISINHKYYSLSYSYIHCTPIWVSWVLTSDHTDGPIPRSRKFKADPLIKTLYRVDWYEYRGSGYDRGHMCPAGDNKWNKDAMYECFYMSNICPQDPSLNGGSWKDLEEASREWAIRENEIYIVCGPIYAKNKRHEKIGTEHAIDVPEAFYKVILSLRKGHEKAIGFYYTNSSDSQSMTNTARSVDDIEEITGIDFFSNLDDKTESRLESSFSLNEW